ncbi:hypothetical protein K435DRAFT_833382 [Dendrothele bispora CBS 962.96]|uniref:Uncharacterized protein n=1 Tax=Dendrothele bispora (strain CBS 962.96) TaxID=1314807 RepID=A0A4S8MXN5_DENBC|nr:hypothetical protein K435DRAFT_833382 [Dendrothele bispora CBS 962.96]
MDIAISAIAPFLKNAPALDLIVPLVSSLSLPSSLWVVSAKSNSVSRSSDFRMEDAMSISSSIPPHYGFEKWGLLVSIIAVTFASAPILLAARTTSSQRDDPPNGSNDDCINNDAGNYRGPGEETEKDSEPFEGAPPPPPPDSNHGVVDDKKRPYWTWQFFLALLLVLIVIEATIEMFTRFLAKRKHTQQVLDRKSSVMSTHTHPTTDLIVSPGLDILLPFSAARLTGKNDWSNVTSALLSALFIYGIIGYTSKKEGERRETTWQMKFPILDVPVLETATNKDVMSTDIQTSISEEWEKNGQECVEEEIEVTCNSSASDGSVEDDEILSDELELLSSVELEETEEAFKDELDNITDIPCDNIAEEFDTLVDSESSNAREETPSEATEDWEYDIESCSASATGMETPATRSFVQEQTIHEIENDMGGDMNRTEMKYLIEHQEIDAKDEPLSNHIVFNEPSPDPQAVIGPTPSNPALVFASASFASRSRPRSALSPKKRRARELRAMAARELAVSIFGSINHSPEKLRRQKQKSILAPRNTPSSQNLDLDTPRRVLPVEKTPPKLSRRQLARLRALELERLHVETDSASSSHEPEPEAQACSLTLASPVEQTSRAPLQPLNPNHPLGILSRRIERANQRAKSPITRDAEILRDVADIYVPKASEGPETENLPDVPVTRAQAWGRVAGLLERKKQHD